MAPPRSPPARPTPRTASRPIRASRHPDPTTRISVRSAGPRIRRASRWPRRRLTALDARLVPCSSRSTPRPPSSRTRSICARAAPARRRARTLRSSSDPFQTARRSPWNARVPRGRLERGARPRAASEEARRAAPLLRLPAQAPPARVPACWRRSSSWGSRPRRHATQSDDELAAVKAELARTRSELDATRSALEKLADKVDRLESGAAAGSAATAGPRLAPVNVGQSRDQFRGRHRTRAPAISTLATTSRCRAESSSSPRRSIRSCAATRASTRPARTASTSRKPRSSRRRCPGT